MSLSKLFSSSAGRRRLPALGGALAVLVAVLLVGADALGLLKPLPPAATLLTRMERSAAEMETYEASLMVFGGAGSPGDTCRQWKTEQGQIITLVKTMLGYQHVQRWSGDTWEFYHPGLGLQGKVRVRNSSQLSCPHWLVSGYPTLGELVTAISTAGGHVVEGRGTDSAGEVWMVRCRPTLLGGQRAAEPGESLLTTEWRVTLLHPSTLPARITPAAAGNARLEGISISSIRAGSTPPEKDWRALAGPVQVRRRREMECDAASPAGVRAVTNTLRAEFAEYLRSRSPMPQGSTVR